MSTIDLEKVPPEALAKMQEKAANKPEPIDNTELVQQFREQGGQILHLRPMHLLHGWTRGMTAAYVVKGNRMILATSLVHAVDHFAKKNGTKTAIEHFLSGKVVTLPIPKGRKAVNVLRLALNTLTGRF